MSDVRHPTIPPPPPFTPEKPTGVRRKARDRHKKRAKAYLAEDARAACAILQDLVKRGDA